MLCDPRPERFIPARAGNTSHCLQIVPAASVHPRSRGEHTTTRSCCGSTIGSSPLARGTQEGADAAHVTHRFIPARAGNTSELLEAAIEKSVHPRSRGEHIASPAVHRRSRGSSPLARGTPADAGPSRASFRFIPARAGNTSGPPPPSTDRPVHPRSRGEHAGDIVGLASASGSSPLARGTPGERGDRGRPARFIPARAGNTAARLVPVKSSSVHPRSRGEHSSTSICPSPKRGSSPLARGTPGSATCDKTPVRFIPARAGNTTPGAPSAATATVHPRSRGEHNTGRLGGRSLYGSSPLARGTREQARGACRDIRFIPARAGNTTSGNRVANIRTVHPRSRGEHLGDSATGWADNGSSPLARGTPPAPVDGARPVRFIPARAGNTLRYAVGRSHPAVHPRSRGEHLVGPLRVPAGRGSSPLARGTPSTPRSWPPPGRFIPARAGNTPRS